MRCHAKAGSLDVMEKSMAIVDESFLRIKHYGNLLDFPDFARLNVSR